MPQGNIDLYAQPKVKNPDGTTSTVDSRSYNIDGKEVLLPSVTPDGRHLRTDNEIVAEYEKTGRHLGKFNSVAEANAYAEQLHNDYAAGKYDRATAKPQGSTPFSIVKSEPLDMKGVTPELYAQGYRLEKGPGWQQVRRDPKVNPEHEREDNSIAGMPPEAAVVSGIGLARAVASGGPTIGSKVVAGAKNVVGQAAPVVKYEVVKGGLESVGIPTPIAMAIATAVSAAGTPRGRRAPRVPKTAAPPVEVPPVAAPVTPELVAAPPAPYETAIAEAKAATRGAPPTPTIVTAPVATPRAPAAPPLEAGP